MTIITSVASVHVHIITVKSYVRMYECMNACLQSKSSNLNQRCLNYKPTGPGKEESLNHPGLKLESNPLQKEESLGIFCGLIGSCAQHVLSPRCLGDGLELSMFRVSGFRGFRVSG